MPKLDTVGARWSAALKKKEVQQNALTIRYLGVWFGSLELGY